MSMQKAMRYLLRATLVAGIIFLFGCGAKGIKPVSPMDTPEHHNLLGMTLLEKGKFHEALKEFERAKDLDAKYAPAYVGIGLTMGELNRFDEAFSTMKRGKKLASSKPDKVLFYSGMIRLYTKWNGKDWLEKAEENFSKGKKVDRDHPAPYYYIAVAYKTANEYEKAAENFKKVIALNKGYVEKADMGWEAVQRIQRAMPGTKVGKKIAGLDKITRADVAALFIQELKLEKLFRQKKVPKRKASVVAIQPPTDYQKHVLRADIDAVVDIGIRGFEPIGNRFDPDKEITRANFAVMIEDILVKITREDDLPAKYIGAESPFKDVDSSHYAFNAIMTCTTRGIMKADLNGYFKGEKPVSGADALLILRRLKDALEQQ